MRKNAWPQVIHREARSHIIPMEFQTKILNIGLNLENKSYSVWISQFSALRKKGDDL